MNLLAKQKQIHIGITLMVINGGSGEWDELGDWD